MKNEEIKVTYTIGTKETTYKLTLTDSAQLDKNERIRLGLVALNNKFIDSL